MGCIRVPRLLDYINEPLQRCACDKDAYVRKTVAICIAKVWDLSPAFVDECGLLDVLASLVDDKNATVVASAVSAMADIDDKLLRGLPVHKLLAAIHESSEWGQIALFDAVNEPENEQDILLIIAECTPRLQHVNAAVVMSAARLLLKFLAFMTNEQAEHVKRKIGGAMTTLVSISEPEVQYTVLRNCRIVHGSHPDIFPGCVKSFFCRYNEPLYVKAEKLEMLVQLFDGRDKELVIDELVDYARDVDVGFAKKAVQSLAKVATNGAEKLVAERLQSLLEAGVMAEQIAVVIDRLYDRKPALYSAALPVICSLHMSDADAKIAQLHMMSRANNVNNESLEEYVENFALEPDSVRSALLDTVFVLLAKHDSLRGIFEKIAASSDSLALTDKASLYKDISEHKLAFHRITDTMLRTSYSNPIDSILQNIDLLMANLNSAVSVLHMPITGARPAHETRVSAQKGVDEATRGSNLLDLSDWDDDHTQINVATYESLKSPATAPPSILGSASTTTTASLGKSPKEAGGSKRGEAGTDEKKSTLIDLLMDEL